MPMWDIDTMTGAWGLLCRSPCRIAVLSYIAHDSKTTARMILSWSGLVRGAMSRRLVRVEGRSFPGNWLITDLVKPSVNGGVPSNPHCSK